MQLNKKTEDIIQNNNLKIDILNKQIEKSYQKFPLKQISALRKVSLTGIGFVVLSMLGSFILNTVGLPYGTYTLAIGAGVGMTMLVVPALICGIADNSLQKYRIRINSLESENSKIKQGQANSLIKQAVFETDFSKLDNEVIDCASKNELKSVLKVLTAKEQGDNLSSALVPVYASSNKVENNKVKTLNYKPKTINRNSH